jgi:hypothetical protein
MIGAITSPVAALSGRSVRALWTTFNVARKTNNGLKHSVGEVKAGISAYIDNTINTNNAVAEWSQDIAKLVWWLPYKVRMLPSSSWSSTILSKKWDALYISENIFNSSEFQKQLQKSIESQWLVVDTKKLRVSMDYFWRLQFIYPGKFNNQAIFLDQFWEGTPTHTALTNAIKDTISTENKKMCCKIGLWHILKDNLAKHNWNIKGNLEWENYSFWLQDAVQLIMDEWSSEKLSTLSTLLEEQWSSLTGFKDVINAENISPKDMISRFPEWRKVMEKAFYIRKNNEFSFDSVDSIPFQLNRNTQSIPNNEQSTISRTTQIVSNTIPSNSTNQITNTSSVINTTNSSTELNTFEQYLDTFNTEKEKLSYINNIINNAPNIASTNLQFYLKMMSLKTQLEDTITNPPISTMQIAA